MARNKPIKPNKKELAQMKVLSDLGYTPTAISKRMGKSHHTVIKYLNSDVYNDPDIQQMVETIKEKELSDLFLLGAKARNRLHELLDDGNTKMIETCAVMDRSFQQRRLLEDKSTANISQKMVFRVVYDDGSEETTE
jgi:hypothetical protein